MERNVPAIYLNRPCGFISLPFTISVSAVEKHMMRILLACDLALSA
ncbi:hypothetical protein [Achromobacter xylosoxidans]|nr:hypothetical protein [Achromobacter xylosoxidans]MCH4573211.1 hypothetical protein [Achromobacter xylosoxidans]